MPRLSDDDNPPKRARGAGGRPRRPGVTEAILEAAVSLAAEGGLEDLTLDSIAARAGVGRPTIYRRWQSKDALLAEAIDVISDRYFSPPDTGSVRDDLVLFAREQIERVQSPLRSLWEALYNVEEAGLGSDAVKRALDKNDVIIRRGVERGELRSDTDPELLMTIIFAPIWYRVTAHHRRLESSFAVTIVDAVLDSWYAEPAHDDGHTARRQRRTRPLV